MYDQHMLASARQRADQRSAEQHRLVQALLGQRRAQRQERRADQALARAGRAARLVAI